MTTAVVDTSLALKWTFAEDYSVEAQHLLDDWTAQDVISCVPSWFACEITNAVFQRVRGGTSDPSAAKGAVRDILAIVSVRDFDPAASVRALEIALQLSQKASYDSQYLALAEHLDCELWTADERFWRAATPAFPRVRWIGEISTGVV